MNKTFTRNLLLLAVSLFALPSAAQLSSNPDKFLGNITTSYNHDVDTHGFIFADYWNQITPENCTKWDAIEPSRGNFSFGNPDKSANYAKRHNFPFKYHTFIWGGQYPGWMNDLSTAEQYRAIIEYLDGVKKHYPNLEIIDVVNEAIDGHAPAPYKAALGGNGRTGYDWIIKAFQLAHERWPNAILVYNDYNSFTWQKSQFINLVRTLRDAGAPVDAYGHQSHDLTDISKNDFVNAMNEIHNALQMPMYSTEFDIGTSDNSKQKKQYENLIPVLWEADYCAGITLWGWIYGSTWTTDGNSGLIRDGKERPALTWLREYMQTDAAKNAKSPFPGFKKEASVYVKPASMKVAKEDVLPVLVDATLATKTIEKVELYMGSTLVDTKTESPYIFEVSSSSTGTKTLKAVVTATDGSTFERLSRISVQNGATKREPYNETLPALPCTIKVGEFDKGISGVAYNNVTRNSDDTSAPIKVSTNSWMEYTVNLAEEGLYTLDVEVAATQEGGMFHLVDNRFGDMIFLTDFITVPKTGSTEEFTTVRCAISEYLTAGSHVLSFIADKGPFYVKNMKFNMLPTSSLPGIVEAENFFQSSGVAIINANDGFVVSNTKNNDWMEYPVNVTQAGKYSYEATVSSAVSGSAFKMTLIESDGNEKLLATVSVPKSDTYQVKTAKIRNSIKEGEQKLRITVTGAGCNIDNIKFTCTTPSGITELTDDDTDTGVSYNLAGQKVGTGYKGIVIRNGRKVFVK
jgi:GH35 family endo-1,4-beta-xylanase